MESLTNEQRELVEKNHNLIYGFASKKNLNIDDCYDILAIGLCCAAKIFDESKGKFSTVAYQCMQNELIKNWRYSQGKTKIPNNMILSYDASRVSEDFMENGSYVDVFVDNHDIDEILIAKAFKNTLFNLLNEKDRQIAEFVIQGMIYDEIATKLNCSKQMVGYRVQRIRKTCADYLNKNKHLYSWRGNTNE